MILGAMENWKFAAALLACVSAAMAFTCPDDAHSFYHADVSTGCQVYHFCQNSQLQTLTCSSGKAFNHETSQCDDASTVNCVETMGEHSHHHHHHHHHKRSVEDDHLVVKSHRETRDKNSINFFDYIVYFTNIYFIQAFNGFDPAYRYEKLLPVFYEMMENEQNRQDILSLFISMKDIFKPMISEMLKQQNLSNSDSKTIEIPRIVYYDCINKFFKQNSNTIKNIFKRVFNLFVKSEVDFVAKMDRWLKNGKYPHAKELKTAFVYFSNKHGSLLQTSTVENLKLYPVKEILEDVKPIKDVLRRLFKDYYNLSEESWLNLVSGYLPAVKKDKIKLLKPFPKLYSKKSA